MRGTWIGIVGVVLVLNLGLSTRHVDADDSLLVKALQELDARVIPAENRERATRMIGEYYSARIKAANAKSSADWAAIKSLPEWERYREEKLVALKASLGRFPEAPPASSLVWEVTKQIAGDGFVIKCVLFQSRPGVWVSANLYQPAEPRASMPGFIISHSHHTSKTNGELQDMGMTWARMGCVVLVPDHMGHGERRQHPFSTERDYPSSFRVSRQDYYFRYDLAVQAHLAGESYVGQLVWDLSRGIDLLLAQPGVDPKRIALLGAVAGGGDPAAVTAALDRRIQVAVPFNFGGPQPETTYPLPADAETSFNYAGSGSWESTRNLKRSAVDGFLPWVIVGSVAPRSLIYGHEFTFDEVRDPVWKRLQTISKWHQPASGLAETHGFGSVKQTDGSHCTHIGKLHRVAIHAALSQWFGLPDGAKAEYSQRRDSAELLCWTDERRANLKPRAWREALNEKVTQQLGARRRRTATPSPEMQRAIAKREWSPLLFDATDAEKHVARDVSASYALPTPQAESSTHRTERLNFETEPGINVPVLLLTPRPTTEGKRPLVVIASQAGKGATLKSRAAQIAKLLESGRVVCLLDPRGIGETSVGNDRDRSGEMTSRSSTQFMLGGSMIGKRLRDVLAVLSQLKQRPDIDGRSVALWGDSLAPVNAPDARLIVPHAIDDRPKLVEPTGQLLALFAALFDDDVKSVLISDGLTNFQSVLDRPTVHVPHDAIIPDMLTLGDVTDFTQLFPSENIRVVNARSSGNQAVSNDDSLADAIEWLSR